jgi:hypothetical protein
VALDRGLGELFRWGTDYVLPVPLGCLNLRGLMDADVKGQVALINAHACQEAQEESDQAGVAVNEDDSFQVVRWLTFRALAPVGDGTGDE